MSNLGRMEVDRRAGINVRRQEWAWLERWRYSDWEAGTERDGKMKPQRHEPHSHGWRQMEAEMAQDTSRETGVPVFGASDTDTQMPLCAHTAPGWFCPWSIEGFCQRGSVRAVPKISPSTECLESLLKTQMSSPDWCGSVDWMPAWVAGLISGQGTGLGCGPNPQLGVCVRQPHTNVSLPLSPTF